MDIKLDEGFQFGLGAFETIAVEEGRPILLDRHLRRLERAAAFLDLVRLLCGVSQKKRSTNLSQIRVKRKHGTER